MILSGGHSSSPHFCVSPIKSRFLRVNSSYSGTPNPWPNFLGGKKKDGLMIPSVKLPAQPPGNLTYALSLHNQNNSSGAFQNFGAIELIPAFLHNFEILGTLRNGFGFLVAHLQSLSLYK